MENFYDKKNEIKVCKFNSLVFGEEKLVIIFGWLGCQRNQLDFYVNNYCKQRVSTISLIRKTAHGKDLEQTSALINAMQPFLQTGQSLNIVFHVFSMNGYLGYVNLVEEMIRRGFKEESMAFQSFKGIIMDSCASWKSVSNPFEAAKAITGSIHSTLNSMPFYQTLCFGGRYCKDFLLFRKKKERLTKMDVIQMFPDTESYYKHWLIYPFVLLVFLLIFLFTGNNKMKKQIKENIQFNGKLKKMKAMLMIYSEKDYLIPSKDIEEFVKMQKETFKGEIQTKKYSNSYHVTHGMMNNLDYFSTVNNFLRKVF